MRIQKVPKGHSDSIKWIEGNVRSFPMAINETFFFKYKRKYIIKNTCKSETSPSVQIFILQTLLSSL